MPLKFLGAAKVSSKNMITIPKDVRDKLKVKPGEHLLFYQKDGEVVVRTG